MKNLPEAMERAGEGLSAEFGTKGPPEIMPDLTGYAHPRYALSLKGFGEPRPLLHCGGWLLERPIPGTSYKDGMGCYPLFACRDWSRLHRDLENMSGELVSLSLVTDPFGEYDVAYLRRCFRDIVIPFKQHFVTDLNVPMDTRVCQNHRRNARKALQAVYLERCTDAVAFIDDWTRLYAVLVERHHIRGISAFSRSAFLQQLDIPGIVVFRAAHGGSTVGMLLWYIRNDVAYYHLGAYDPLGYELKASFALFWFAMDYFCTTGVRWLDIGAGAGVNGCGTDGLTRFKRGWSTETRPAYFCGLILDPPRYRQLAGMKGMPATEYFPAYRIGEFG
jgi:hypothetical protein